MYFALDKDGNRISVEDAIKTEEYTCPMCGEPVICKQGRNGIWYFGHRIGFDCDRWEYDISEWHRMMQNHFSKDKQEVIVEYNGEKHRADVLVDDTVIEFQHAQVNAKTVATRTRFYELCGYRVVWIFDMADLFAEGQICDDPKTESGNKLVWKYAWKTFDWIPSVHDLGCDISICFAFFEDKEFLGNHYSFPEYSTTGEWKIARIQWASETWKYLRICYSCEINANDLSDSMNLDLFFNTPKDTVKDSLDKVRNILDSAHINSHYEIKCCGSKGHPRNSYICPLKPDVFGGIKFECQDCKYCGGAYIYTEQRQGKYGKEPHKCMDVYCFHPTEIKDRKNPHIDRFFIDNSD